MRFLIALTSVFLPAFLHAANETKAVFSPVDPLSSESLLRLFGGLLLVLMLAAAVVWGLKRLQQSPAGNGTAIQLLATLPVGQRERVMLVQLGEEQLVLGVTPGNIVCLHVLQKPLHAEALADGNASFSGALKHVIEQGIKR